MKCLFVVECSDESCKLTKLFCSEYEWEIMLKDYLKDDDKLGECICALKENNWFELESKRTYICTPNLIRSEDNASEKQIVGYVDFESGTSEYAVYPLDNWKELLKEDLVKHLKHENSFAEELIGELEKNDYVYCDCGEWTVLLK